MPVASDHLDEHGRRYPMLFPCQFLQKFCTSNSQSWAIISSIANALE
jgi:hypothetical protein